MKSLFSMKFMLFFSSIVLGILPAVISHNQHIFQPTIVEDEGSLHHDFSKVINDILESGLEDLNTNMDISCKNCIRLARTFKHISRVSLSHKPLIAIGKQVCIRWKLQTPEICKAAVPYYAPWIFKVTRNPKFSPSEMCIAAGKCEGELGEWEPVFPKPKPVRRRNKIVNPNGEKRYVLHLSDWHYDSEYQEGSEAECFEPLCCRKPQDPTLNLPIIKPAGPFGDYKCDTPKLLAESVMEYAKNLYPEYAFVLMSGDLPPHDVWQTTVDDVKKAEGTVAEDLQRGFPNTTVYMAIGNHEGSPPNYFPAYNTADGNVTWLYESLAKQWKPWLPDETLSTFTKFGYYSTRRPQDNLRIVSLNTNFDYLMNWWIFVAGADPDNMLHWLIDELQSAEDLGEDVYLLGHISPGSGDTSRYFSEAFNKIVQRYNDTIIALFNGHNHVDRMEIFYQDQERTVPVAVGYNCPSITPYTDQNPGFRVFEVDKATNIITNHFTYVLDLKKSNAERKAHWFLEYDAKGAYGLSGLSPADWHDLTVRMLKDEDGRTLVEKFIQYKKKSKHKRKYCDDLCRKSEVCGIRTSLSHLPCLDVDNAYEETVVEETTDGQFVTRIRKVVPKYFAAPVVKYCQ